MASMKDFLHDLTIIWMDYHPGFSYEEAEEYIIKSDKSISYWMKTMSCGFNNVNNLREFRKISYTCLNENEAIKLLSQLHEKFGTDPRHLESDIIFYKRKSNVYILLYGPCKDIDLLNLTSN